MNLFKIIMPSKVHNKLAPYEKQRSPSYLFFINQIISKKQENEL